MSSPVKSANWDGVERRKPDSNRRTDKSRRASGERRLDLRVSSTHHRRTLRGWIRSLTKARLGVDRRKGKNRRIINDRRNPLSQSRLTSEELADLLR